MKRHVTYDWKRGGWADFESGVIFYFRREYKPGMSLETWAERGPSWFFSLLPPKRFCV